ncbi:hypothetical protein CRUP_009335, partial [Coryphaenoides rupestris]
MRTSDRTIDMTVSLATRPRPIREGTQPGSTPDPSPRPREPTHPPDDDDDDTMTTPALLPLSGRRIPALSPGTSSFPHHRATLRLSEKFILLLILSAFITLCFGAFFFLPDNSKHKRFDLGLEDVLIPHIDAPKAGKHAAGQVLIHGQGGHDEHRH